MKNLVKPILIALMLIGLVGVQTVQAQYGCPGGYGGETCPTGNVAIDKKVWNPATSVYVDNIGTDGRRFVAGEEVVYRLTVRNLTDVLIDKADVFDFLPAELEYISGPGTYDVNTREVRFSVEQLGPNASRDYEVKARIVAADKLPQDRSLIVVVNKAEARLDGVTDTDTTQIVIGQPFAGGLPETGPVEVMLFVSGVSVAAGVLLTTRANKLIGE